MENCLIIDNKRIYDIDTKPFYKGEYSELYLGMERAFSRKVIIKKVAVSNNLQQLKSEVVVISKLSNVTSHVPLILDMKHDKKNLYIVMQYIAGNDLSTILQKPVSSKDALNYAKQLCQIVGILHSHKYQHRDLKPENIRISTDRQLYLIDFNISALAHHKGNGSENYRAPESDWGYAVKGNHCMDVFSLGVILYQLFTGYLPLAFVDYVADYNDLKWQVFNEPITKNKNLNPKINAIICKCMKLNPKERYQNANQILADLRKVRNVL